MAGRKAGLKALPVTVRFRVLQIGTARFLAFDKIAHRKCKASVRQGGETREHEGDRGAGLPVVRSIRGKKIKGLSEGLWFHQRHS